MFRSVVVLTPGCSWLATALLTEPWRLANDLPGGPVAAWEFRSWTGEPVRASNGMALEVAGSCNDAAEVDLVAVIASEDVERAAQPGLLQWLRRRGEGPGLVAGIDAGADLLARAGILTGHAAAMHHEAVHAFREQYLGIEIFHGRYLIDERRATCAGSATTLDFSLALLRRFAGGGVAARTADRLIHTSLDDSPGTAPPAAAWLDDRLRRAIHVIASDSAEPGVVSRAADAAGVSDRHLHRLFSAELGMSPTAFAVQVRARRARTLLAETAVPITSVAIACGYAATSEFTRAFRRECGTTPTEYRRVHRRAAQPAASDAAPPTAR